MSQRAVRDRKSNAYKRSMTFLNALRDNQLINDSQQQLLSKVLGVLRAPAIAQRLIDHGVITRWQAKALLDGEMRLLYGKYLVLEKIANGGNSEIFRGRRLKSRRPVAIKVFPDYFALQPDGLARFHREFTVGSSLCHPNIAKTHDADTVDGIYFLVTEYLEGRDLHQWQAEHERLPIRWACECIRQAACGMEYARKVGLIHRDLKPANLMVVARDTASLPRVKILDLGCALLTAADGERLTGTNQILGTPDFIAPEQAMDSRNADTRSDVFSLGCTLFKLLTGELPFAGTGILQKMAARAAGKATPIRQFRAEVPAELGALIAKALSRWPDDRFQTPGELAAALRPFSLATDDCHAAAP